MRYFILIASLLMVSPSFATQNTKYIAEIKNAIASMMKESNLQTRAQMLRTLNRRLYKTYVEPSQTDGSEAEVNAARSEDEVSQKYISDYIDLVTFEKNETINAQTCLEKRKGLADFTKFSLRQFSARLISQEAQIAYDLSRAVCYGVDPQLDAAKAQKAAP